MTRTNELINVTKNISNYKSFQNHLHQLFEKQKEKKREIHIYNYGNLGKSYFTN